MKISWREGEYFDLWITIHLMSGITGGTGLLIIHLPEFYAWIVCIVLAVGWEAFEFFSHIIEHKRNRLIDILVAIVGGSLGYLYLRSLNFSQQTNITVFIVEAVVLITLNIIGWKDYKKYGRGI